MYPPEPSGSKKFGMYGSYMSFTQRPSLTPTCATLLPDAICKFLKKPKKSESMINKSINKKRKALFDT